jgi:hypothetical protein
VSRGEANPQPETSAKRARPPRRKNPTAARNREITRLMMEGETYEQTGKRFGISRQRVHQILDARRVPPAERRALLEGDLAPYFAQGLEPRCCSCGTGLDRRQTPFCEPCRQLIRAVRRIKSLLRAAQRGHAQALRQAHHEIGRSKIQPEDLTKA